AGSAPPGEPAFPAAPAPWAPWTGSALASDPPRAAPSRYPRTPPSTPRGRRRPELQLGGALLVEADEDVDAAVRRTTDARDAAAVHVRPAFHDRHDFELAVAHAVLRNPVAFVQGQGLAQRGHV